MEKLILRLR